MPATVTATPLGTPVVRLSGEFDLNDAVHVEAALHEAFEAEHIAVIVDLTRVEFLDSMTLRQIAHAHHRANSLERRLVLVRPDPIVWRVFTVTGLASLISSADSVDEAEEQLGRAVGAAP